MSTDSESTKILQMEEIQIRRRVRCISCELVQWAREVELQALGIQLPQPIINVVEVETPVPVEITVHIDRPCLRCELGEHPSLIPQYFPG